MDALKKVYKGKNVLITGGLGLIGSNLAIKLVKLGANVTIADLVLPQYGANFFNIKNIIKKIKIEIADIRDQKAMEKLVKDKDFIFNFAAQVSHNDSLKDPFLDLDINCKGHLTVLEACRKYNKKARIFFSGSRLQFGKIQYLPVDEKHPQEPLSVYGVHKMAGEKYYLLYNREFGLDTIVFRIANPYGPRSQMKHSKYSIVNWFIRQAMENKPITIFGEGNQLRDYIYIDDLVNAFLIAGVKKESKGNAYNVGSGVGTTFRKMCETVIKVVKKGRIEFVEWPKDYKNIETGDYVTDITKIKNLGWKPKTSLEEGIKKTFEYYKKYKKYYW